MKKMRFDVKCVRECLIKNKVVFTVRKWKSYEENSLVEVDGVGICLKQRVRKISGKEDLVDVVRLSGFNSLDEWWDRIREFAACGGWLYRVELYNTSLHETKDNFVLYEDVKTRRHGARLVTTRKVIELVKLPHEKFQEKTIGIENVLKPLVCREFCEKSKSCKLIETGFGDLCKHRGKHGIVVKRVSPKPSREPRPRVRWVKSAARSIWLDDYESNWKTDANGNYIRYIDPRMVPEAALTHGINQKTAVWEDYSAAPFQDAYSDITYWDEPEEGFGVITRKQRADMRAKVEEKRRSRFLMHHGLRLKDKLNDLMFRSPKKAKEIAAKLTFEDWKAIDTAGGLCVHKGMVAGI